jgi:hypothetical protein
VLGRHVVVPSWGGGGGEGGEVKYWGGADLLVASTSAS